MLHVCAIDSTDYVAYWQKAFTFMHVCAIIQTVDDII